MGMQKKKKAVNDLAGGKGPERTTIEGLRTSGEVQGGDREVWEL